MPNKRNNPIDRSELKKLLARFFDKGFEISNDMILEAEKYLFGGTAETKRTTDATLQQTLNYLRNVMQRNHFTDMDDLIRYYDNKRSKISGLYQKLESVDPEECFAISFREACTLYMRIIPNDYAFKSDGACKFQEAASAATPEEERVFMSRVEGNKLAGTGNTCVRRLNELACN